ncbi:MAG: hypothetical protein GY788_21165 [bacterium]|nr:hypothetical protein [bacterium]
MNTRPLVLDLVEAEGGAVFTNFSDGGFNLNLVLVRRPWVAGVFESHLHCCYLNGAGYWTEHIWAATGWPGVPGLRQPTRPEGCAIVATGQYRGAWMIGEHRGKRALVQQGNAIDVWRDNNRDGKPDPGGERHNGYFGIQVHVAGAGTDGGLGCMMTSTLPDQLMLMGLCDKAAERWGDRFSITIVET